MSAICPQCFSQYCFGCPSPAEIAEHAARIRDGWSDAEHYHRAGMAAPAYASWSDETAAHWTAPTLTLHSAEWTLHGEE